MRVTVGAIAVLGLAVTVAVAQPPGRERAATLKPPEVLPPGEVPTARGAVDDFPASMSSTPVGRPTKAPAAAPAPGPSWLTGVDPNVYPAAGLGAKSGSATAPVRALTPPTSSARDDVVPAVPPRFIDRVKGAVTGDKAPPHPLPQPVTRPQAQPLPTDPPTASTAFRGTGVNGAPVFAGPPAYRWYGWGSVTPGANPLAPTGQYPKASANWYSITGATPGAFPVPVANPGRPQPGTEPPTYGLARSPAPPHPVVPIATQSHPQPSVQYADRPEPPRYAPPPESKFAPGGIGAVAPAPAPAFMPPSVPVGVPTLTPPPLPLPKPVTVAPVPPPPAAPPAVAAKEPAVPAPLPAPPAVPTLPKAEPVAVLLPLPPLPAMTPVPSVEPTKPVPAVEPRAVPAVEPRATAGGPAALPPSVTTEPPREEPKWQQSKDPITPPPGTWAPAAGATPLPTVAPGEAPGGPVGRASGAPTVARGQMNDKTPDPIATLIKQLCQGRADGVEIRWTGTKKLQVCFEVRTAPEAQKLVSEVSKRPELTSYQIDFCVLVK